MKLSEKLIMLAEKMRKAEEAVEQSASGLDDALLDKLGIALNALLIGLEKAIDGVNCLVDRFFNN